MPEFLKTTLIIPVLLAIFVNSCLTYGSDGVVKIPDIKQKKRHKALIVLPQNYNYCQKKISGYLLITWIRWQSQKLVQNYSIKKICRQPSGDLCLP